MNLTASMLPNLNVFSKALKSGLAETQLQVRRHARQSAEELLTASKLVVPRDTGKLAGTGFVKGPSGGASKWEIFVGYSANYALYVHEIPPPEEGAPHPDQIRPGSRTAKHDPPTSWKFLQRPAEKMFKGFEIRAGADSDIRSVLSRFV